MEGYKVTIRELYKDISAKDRVKVKDFSNAVPLDEATQDGSLVISFDNLITCDVHNEMSDNKDYLKHVIIDKEGNKYITGSESLITTLKGIIEEMKECGEEDYEIEIYRKDSKNYKGKQFLTCSIV